MNQEYEIKGICEPKFEKVKETFEENFKNGLEVGASCAVTVNGKFVVDLWGGYTDEEKSNPWVSDSIVNVWSSTKIMTALCIHILIDRDLLKSEDPVAKYWPEFAQNGKENILVQHLLRHSAGLFTWDIPYGREDQCDWERAVSLLEVQKPRHEPGTQWNYHAVTFGFLLGNLVKKITGKSIGRFFKEEVATPLKADFHIGLPVEYDSRVADLIAPEIQQGKQSDEQFEKAKKDLNSAIEFTKTRQWRAAEIPGSNGHGNARAMARVGSVIACGGEVNGIRILSENSIEKAMNPKSFKADLIPEGEIKFGLGWMLPESKSSKKPRFALWGGWGGSNITMDLNNKICFSYAMNKMIDGLTGDLRSDKLRRSLYRSL